MPVYMDLSIALEDRPTVPPHHRPQITYSDHHSSQSWKTLKSYYPGICEDDMPEGEAFAVETVVLNSHAGTHMDAPLHYHSTMNHEISPGGQPAATIDEIPLEWCFGRGVKFDFRHLKDGYVVQPEGIDAELDRIGHTLKPGDIVLVNTAAGESHFEPDYVEHGVGVGAAATLHLLRQGVRVVGTDAFSWDAPFSFVAEKFRQTADAGLLWEGHKAGKEIGYFQLEKLANLSQLPSSGFDLVCLPVKLKKASAAWARVVAILPDGGPNLGSDSSQKLRSW